MPTLLPTVIVAWFKLTAPPALTPRLLAVIVPDVTVCATAPLDCSLTVLPAPTLMAWPIVKGPLQYPWHRCWPW